ncbi:hypothetical protein OnM2_056039 [Erysiphe neolycopersici]|uniref:Bacteriophage T5 Orf172 DNA-binding domain-containing protein n=1 Tax=Erysiphe neolycopersici TaxID=212602 RepID=A0A420HQV7_9PEZI|nr:hypothetical protein OnM2_056039 [Erysiphe neolycopersici]
MPYIPNTPESRLQRTDSKDPATTCRGLTTGGKPCRRPISKVIPGHKGGYCWQHGDQAVDESVSGSNLATGGAWPSKLQNRTSVDTLADRLGLSSLEPNNNESKIPLGRQRRRKKRRIPISLLFCCCIGLPDNANSDLRPMKVNQGRPSLVQSEKLKLSKISEGTGSSPVPHRPSNHSTGGKFSSLIPSTTSTETTSRLLAYLSKPTSDKDTPGYIYMFWLTPESLPNEPPTERAASLLHAPSKNNSTQQARVIEILNTFSSFDHRINAGDNSRGAGGDKSSGSHNNSKKRILLKIGRAQNVYRRMNQWTKQCGYNLSLVRYYPYQPSSSSSHQNSPITVPNVNKVERLIHIEIGHMRASFGKCNACGKVHKEWFEVEASQSAVHAVDEVIRRWVDWSIRDFSNTG